VVGRGAEACYFVRGDVEGVQLYAAAATAAEMANPWARLNELCPELRELIVIFGGGLSKDSVVEDWVEVGRRRVPVELWNWRWDLPNFRATTFVAKSLGRVKMVDVMLVKARKSVKATCGLVRRHESEASE